MPELEPPAANTLTEGDATNSLFAQVLEHARSNPKGCRRQVAVKNDGVALAVLQFLATDVIALVLSAMSSDWFAVRNG